MAESKLLTREQVQMLLYAGQHTAVPTFDHEVRARMAETIEAAMADLRRLLAQANVEGDPPSERAMDVVREIRSRWAATGWLEEK